MAYVVTKNCLGSLDRSCVEVCPVDCFYYINDKGLNEKYKKGASPTGAFGMLMINPDECINCGACETECPTRAIYEDSDVPEDLKEFIEMNEKMTMSMSDEERDAARCTEKKE